MLNTNSTNPIIKAVICDMDGLLLDTETRYLEAFRAARIAFDLPPNDDLFLSLVGMPLPAGTKLLHEGLEPHIDPTAFNAAWDARCHDMMAQDIPVKPGVTALINALQAHDIPYAIATSTRTDKARDHLDRAGIGHLFDTIIGGDQVQNGKPAPDIYLRAAKLLGYDPSHAAALEDSENGVRAAVSAGMITVQVPDLKQPSDAFRSLGHHVAGDLFHAARILGLIGAT